MAKPKPPSKSAKSPLTRALKYISFRPRTEAEVRIYLGADCTEELISKLKDLKFIDDAAYVQSYIDQRSRYSPRSARLLAQELKKRGITMNYELLATSDADLAKTALAKKFKHGYTKLQAYRFLASRGFSYSTIESVLKIGYNDGDVT